MLLPDYWLTRPDAQVDESARPAFDGLLDAAFHTGGCPAIQYSLPWPKWQFLCHLADIPENGMKQCEAEGGMKLLVATTNRGKLREIAEILRGAPVELVTLESYRAIPEPDENGTTFAENARLKALYYSNATGLASVADDSRGSSMALRPRLSAGLPLSRASRERHLRPAESVYDLVTQQ